MIRRSHLGPALMALVLIGAALPAQAQITKTNLSMVRPPAGRNSTAFDSVNRVYLVVEAGSPLTGRFLGENGSPVTNAFPITSGSEGFTGWASITFGGTTSDPAFLVTYVAAEGGGAHSKYARVLRYAGGSPSVGGRGFISAVGAEWYAAEKAQTVWFNNRFIVGTRAPGGFIAHAVLHHVDLNGAVSGGQSLGDGQDYYGSPAIACASNGVCLATGYAGGIPLGNPNTNATFSRLFSAETLQPLSGIVYLDGLSTRVEEQAVVYNAKIGRFLAGWWRAGTVQTRLISTNGAMDPAQTSLPDFAGDIAFSYNAATQTTLLVTKRFPADLYALELGDSGLPVNMSNLLLVTPWDGAWPEYIPSIAANKVTGQWLATAVQTNGGRGIMVTGNGGGGGTEPPPPPACSYSLSSSSQGFGAFGGVGGVTVTTTAGCTWNAGSSATWLAPTAGSTSGTGSKLVSYTVASNQSASPRSATLTIGGQVFTVTQQGFVLDAFSARERARGDFNRDGMYDLIWHNASSGYLAAWMLDGVSVKIEAGLSHSMPDLNWEVAGTGDFNGDSKPDLLWRHRQFGFLGVWFMDGVKCFGVVSLSVPRVADIGWKIAAVADFNRDGDPDIVWQHDTGPVVLWTMDGTRVVSDKLLSGDPVLGGDARWKIAAAADMNQDGHTDLLWRHQDGWLASWLMVGSAVAGVNSLSPTAEFDTAWRVVGTIDANRDGRMDIVWQHTDGTVRLWAMEGLTRAYVATIGFATLGGPNWKVVGPN